MGKSARRPQVYRDRTARRIVSSREGDPRYAILMRRVGLSQNQLERKNMRRFISAVGVLMALLLTQAAAQQRTGFTVGTATAAPGQKAMGTIEVPAGSDAPTSIP